MSGTATTLDQLPRGPQARILRMGGETSVVMRLMEMGLLEGETLQVVGKAPFGDPIAVLLRGCRLALRRREAALIHIEVLAPC
ncbi:MAG: ferrous iron transport protein A [Planctomycetaceae bacterium]